jgi:hypothetical protein
VSDAEPKLAPVKKWIFTLGFILLVGGAVWWIRANHAYLTYRFFGGNLNIMEDALRIGELKPRHVLSLAASCRRAEVRGRAMCIVARSDKFEKPYDPTFVAATVAALKNLPENRMERCDIVNGIMELIRASPQDDLFPAAEALASHPDSRVRDDAADALVLYGPRALALLKRNDGRTRLLLHPHYRTMPFDTIAATR